MSLWAGSLWQSGLWAPGLWLVSEITGTAIIQLDSVTTVSSGGVLAQGQLSAVLEDVGLASEGIVASISGVAFITLDDVVSITAGVSPITGALLTTLGNVTLLADNNVSPTRRGTRIPPGWLRTILRQHGRLS